MPLDGVKIPRESPLNKTEKDTDVTDLITISTQLW
jgi:hypothetical protein